MLQLTFSACLHPSTVIRYVIGEFATKTKVPIIGIIAKSPVTFRNVPVTDFFVWLVLIELWRCLYVLYRLEFDKTITLNSISRSQTKTSPILFALSVTKQRGADEARKCCTNYIIISSSNKRLKGSEESYFVVYGRGSCGTTLTDAARYCRRCIARCKNYNWVTSIFTWCTIPWLITWV